MIMTTAIWSSMNLKRKAKQTNKHKPEILFICLYCVWSCHFRVVYASFLLFWKLSGEEKDFGVSWEGKDKEVCQVSLKLQESRSSETIIDNCRKGIKKQKQHGIGRIPKNTAFKKNSLSSQVMFCYFLGLELIQLFNFSVPWLLHR